LRGKKKGDGVSGLKVKPQLLIKKNTFFIEETASSVHLAYIFFCIPFLTIIWVIAKIVVEKNDNLPIVDFF